MRKGNPVKLGIVGVGNMAEAILAGILKKSILTPGNVYAYDINKKRLRTIQRKYKIYFCKDLDELVRNSSILLLCVKPQQINDVMQKIKPLHKNQPIMTIVAGIRTSFYKSILGKKSEIIRMMPNSPAMIGFGATAIFFTKNTKATFRSFSLTLFDAIGTVVEIKKESLMDIVTALSGSGPAFAYSFANALMNAGTKLGLDQKISRLLTLQTLLGATLMMINSTEEPSALTKKVTSKGGTTLAGLEVLHKKKFAKIIEDCIKKAAQRAYQLSVLA